MCSYIYECYVLVVFFQAEDGIRDLVRSRGLGDVYKRQILFPIIKLETGIDFSISFCLIVAESGK